ncbi:MAG: hypothetical protein JXA74_08520 [Anaerolineae bacterium]|nr:hypothetical protein [Anaerolineae bacterium]
MNRFAGGYTGRFLRVDLDSRQTAIEETPDVVKWLGPRGWNILLGWNEVRPGVGPFDPENRLIFSAGPLVGTGATTAGRMSVSSLMPRGYPKPMWASASMGGYLGAELKYAGYDGLVIQGQADAPCYLLIEDDRISLRDASDLWGQGTFATQRTLKTRHSRLHQIAAIGPAGENRVRYASITHRLSNAVGNGGLGGVMGSKNLKAIVVRGTGGVLVADPDGFVEAVRYVWGLVKGGVGGIGQIERGYPVVACTQGCTVNCGMRLQPIADRYGTGTAVRMPKCVNNCWSGGSHPEYRGVFVDGRELYVPKPPGMGAAGHELGHLIEDMGLTAWSYDSWYRYWGALRELGITELYGEKIDIDNPDWWHRWIMQVAHREGIGDDVAEGLARFYDKHQIGPRHVAEFIESAGSRGHGWHREGRAMEPHPSPYWEYSALLYAVSTRDVTPSTHGFFFLNMLYKPHEMGEIPAALLDLMEQVYGSREAAYPGDAWIEHVTAWHQERAVIKDSMGVCDWAFPSVRRTFDTREQLQEAITTGSEPLIGDPSAEALLYRACTGIDMDIETMQRPTAERIITLERCLEVRNAGRKREEDEAVIPHYQWSEKTDRTHLSADAHEFRALLDRYYDLRGWDRATGWPTRERLEALGLADVAQELKRVGKLP